MIPSQLKIFVVDDDEDDRFLFEQALKETGIPMVVSLATNGKELLDLLALNPDKPNIIFLDINMPLMDGLTALKQIRAVDDYDEILIIIFSTSENPEYVRSAYQRGAHLYLKKPNNYKDYIFIFGSLLSGTNEHMTLTETFIRR